MVSRKEGHTRALWKPPRGRCSSCRGCAASQQWREYPGPRKTPHGHIVHHIIPLPSVGATARSVCRHLARERYKLLLRNIRGGFASRAVTVGAAGPWCCGAEGTAPGVSAPGLSGQQVLGLSALEPGWGLEGFLAEEGDRRAAGRGSQVLIQVQSWAEQGIDGSNPKAGSQTREGTGPNSGHGDCRETTSVDSGIRAPREPAAELHLQNHPAPCPAGPQVLPREKSVWGPWGQESRWMCFFCPVSADALYLRVTEISFCFNRRKMSHGKWHPVFSFGRWRKEITYTKVSFGE